MPVVVKSQPFAEYREFFIKALPHSRDAAEMLYTKGLSYEDPEAQEQYFTSVLNKIRRKVTGEKSDTVEYHHKPVDIETFVRDKYYLGLNEEVYPEVMPYLIEMNSGRYVEVVLTGGIGCAKTTLALWTQAYQLYLLSMMKNPHEVFDQDRASELELIFQNITASLAESVDFARFKTLIHRSPYFRENFSPDMGLKSELHFPNRIIVKPVSGSNLATIGQNVIGGLIDELNYMSVVEKSKKSVDDGVYNQAIEVYNSIARRRKSRFMRKGTMPGILCLVSSKKYPGQFTDTKMEEAKDDPTIYVYDKRVWDIKPASFSKKRFTVFIGDDTRKPRIADEGEKFKEKDKDLLITVPEDFKVDFKKDPVNALREIAGVSHLSKHPFFTNPEALLASFKPNIKSIFSRDTVNFNDQGLAIIKANIKNLQYPRFAHVDLALTGDSAGLAIGYCPGFHMAKGRGMKERMPIIRLDGALEIKPPGSGGEIPFWRIRKLFYLLREMGVMLKWITFDTFQSADSMQVLRQRGFIVGPQSVDRSMTPYDFYKSAVYEDRMQCPEHPVMFREAKDLQVDTKNQKVDHLPQGSKDVTDAVAAVVYGLTLRRETWTMHGVPVSEIPEDIMRAAKEVDRKVVAHKGPLPANEFFQDGDDLD